MVGSKHPKVNSENTELRCKHAWKVDDLADVPCLTILVKIDQEQVGDRDSLNNNDHGFVV